FPVWFLDAEAFSATARVVDVRVVDHEQLLQPVLDEIELRPVEEGEAVRADDDGRLVRFERGIAAPHLVGEVERVGKARAPDLLDSEAQADALSALRDLASNSLRRVFGERDSHGFFVPRIRPRPACGPAWPSRACPAPARRRLPSPAARRPAASASR